MKKEKTKKKSLFNIDLTAIKNVLKSKEVRKAAKEAAKAVKDLRDTFYVN